MGRHFAFALTVVAGLGSAAFGQQDSGRRAPSMTPQELAAWIDEQFAEQYHRAGIEPASQVDDATYLRRVFLDLQGRIPTVAQLRDFLSDQGSMKRPNYVERLVNGNERPDRFADRTAANLSRVWRRMMVPASAPKAAMAVGLEPWLARQFAANTPYDEFARKLLLVSPPQPIPGAAAPVQPAPDADAAAAIFQQAIGPMPENLASAYVRVFLGVRLNCAQCHDHPFTDWKRDDFWGVAAFFSGDGSMPARSRPPPTIVAGATSGARYAAKLLWDEEPLKELPGGKSSREVLADWMTSPDNPNFAATAVNRTWQYLCGRGLAGSVDDLDQVSPEERQVLDQLAQRFIASGYDLRWLVMGICQSRVYQQSHSKEAAEGERFMQRPLKTLLPEQIFDSLEQALGLPVAKADRGPRYNGQRDQFVARMNEAAPETPMDFKAGIPQALMLMNGKLTVDATSLHASRMLRAVVEAPFLKPAEKIETMYFAALTRKPSAAELEYLLDYVNKQPVERRKQAYAQVLWGLLNSPEFVLSR